MDKNQNLEKQLKSSFEHSQNLVQKWLEKYETKNTNKQLIEENIQAITAIRDTQGVGYTGHSDSKMNIKIFSRIKKNITKNKKDSSKIVERDEESRTEQMIRTLSNNRNESKSLKKKRKHK